MPGSQGFNSWFMPTGRFGGVRFDPMGVDNNLMTFYVDGPSTTPSLQFYTFSYSAPSNIVPVAPSSVPWNASLPPTSIVTPATSILCMDAHDNVWTWWNTNVRSVNTNHIQSYSASTGNVLSDTNVRGGTDFLADFGTSFIVAGQYYLAVWYATFSSLLFTETQARLEVFNISSGSPISIGSITLPLDPSGFSIGFGTDVFCDGANTLWFFQYALDDPSGGEPTGGTLHKVDFASMVVVASASYTGPYAFIGNPNDGHIYLLNIDGTVSDVDPVTLSIIKSYPLGTSIATSPGPLGSAFYNVHAYPFFVPTCTHLMKNSTFGISVDILCSQQFFLTYPQVGGPILNPAYTRIQNLAFVDTLVLFADWGLTTFSPFFASGFTMWVPWRQSMIVQGLGGSTSSPLRVVYEFMYGACSVCTDTTLEFR